MIVHKFPYKVDLPLTETCYRAKIWEMEPDQVKLFMQILGCTINNGARYGLDEMPMNGVSSTWHFAVVKTDGTLLVWCPNAKSTRWEVADQEGRFVRVQETDFRIKRRRRVPHVQMAAT